MKTRTIITALFAGLLSTAALAQGTPQYKWYGFIRNYFVYDSHESSAGTEELYYYMPKESDGKGTANFVSLTSRLGLDVTGYEVEGYKVGAKIEADFYSKSGTTAILRLRQAYMTLAKDNRSWKIGQAWHPMAADLPDIFSLESGAPFGPFSRTPQLTFDYSLGSGMSLTASAIWQMQYTSTGPAGATADYLKHSYIPELYLGFNWKQGGNLARIGADVLSIKPEGEGRLTTANFFVYDQYSSNGWTFKEKLTFANDGSHMNMVGGYGITLDSVTLPVEDHQYSATRNISFWGTVSNKQDKHWMPCLLYGYVNNLGTSEEIAKVGDVAAFYCKNSANRLNQLFRIQPEIVYNLGKVQFGAEYMLTAAQYGTPDMKYSFAESANLKWYMNHRIQFIAKYTF